MAGLKDQAIRDCLNKSTHSMLGYLYTSPAVNLHVARAKLPPAPQREIYVCVYIYVCELEFEYVWKYDQLAAFRR